jgi:hypothetical protein
MAFLGGALNTIGINSPFITQTLTQAASAGFTQVYQGSGQSFFGSANQSLLGNQAGSAVNIALNSLLGTQVAGPQGLSLTSGANLLASTITPYVTSQVAAGINQSIQSSLKSAGAFGPVLSTIGTGLVNQAFQGLTNSIFGGAGNGLGGPGGTNYKMFPGGGGEAASDYGGSAYTLTDVVFNLCPANRGPQQDGLAKATNTPTTATKVPVTSNTKVPLKKANPVANKLKKAAINNNVKQINNVSKLLEKLYGKTPDRPTPSIIPTPPRRR